MSIITAVERGSPLSGRIFPGETVAAINGHEIKDVLDYAFYSYDSRLVIEVAGSGGERRNLRVEKGEGRDLGLVFDSYLMDSEKSCKNRCVFCFIDQLPRGMRRTLYFKDDDARLSILTGNYVTLTNLPDSELERIRKLRVSPLNVSVHATDPDVRAFMLGNPDGALGYERLKFLAESGIELNCQIVCCPGINDGEVLTKTMSDLAALYPALRSVSVVPVGLTRHREGLFRIDAHSLKSALETIRRVDAFGGECLEKFGSRLFFCADEFYLKAGLEIPGEDYYEDYYQLENGVGMLRLLEAEFRSGLEALADNPKPFAVATGTAAAPFIEKLIAELEARCRKLEHRVYAIQNDFFGHSIDVAGLVTGGDMIAQLKGRELYGRLLIPDTMLRAGEEVFLDGVTLAELQNALGVEITAVNRYGLLDGILGNRG